MGRREAARDAYATLLALVGSHVWWSPTHAKIAVIDGPADCVVLTGGANFMSGGQLDLVRVRRGDRDLAALARSILKATPREAAPPPPSAAELDAARKRSEAIAKRRALDPGTEAWQDEPGEPSWDLPDLGGWGLPDL